MTFEMHCHTRHGSSCSYMTPEELVEQAVRVGLDGVCITEHDLPWDRSATEQLSDRFGILVIGGMEISTEFGEVLVWGLHESVFDVKDIHDLRSRVDRAGGVMVAAHPFRGAHSLVRWDPVEGLVTKLDQAVRLPIFGVVDAMEVFNGMAPDWELDLSAAACDRLPIMGTGGSDAHNVDTVGECVTVLENRVATEEAFCEEIKNGRYRAQHRLIGRYYPANGVGALQEKR
jgi:predicted metal-dependent phosphoesterase TrpH